MGWLYTAHLALSMSTATADLLEQLSVTSPDSIRSTGKFFNPNHILWKEFILEACTGTFTLAEGMTSNDNKDRD